jgi:acetyltransferase-like isoleucine patch superfamily enzyme
MGNLLLNVRRAETPLYLSLKKALKFFLTVRLPLPALSKPVFQIAYGMHFATRRLGRRFYMFAYGEPLFRSRCDRFGANCFVWALPEITGHTRISVGDNVSFWGDMHIISGRGCDAPTLVIGDGAQIGHNVLIVVNRRVVIEEGALIGNDCYITDSNAHPRDATQRLAQCAPSGSDLAEVRIGRHAWIGVDCTIYKGVTIGEGAIVGTRSVVLSDVPAYTTAMGNPARVIASARAASSTGK